MKEVGFPDVGTIAWNGLFAPAATPKPVLEELHRIVMKALQAPTLQEKFKKQMMNVAPSKTVADAQSWLDGEIKHWQTITTSVKIMAVQ